MMKKKSFFIFIYSNSVESIIIIYTKKYNTVVVFNNK